MKTLTNLGASVKRLALLVLSAAIALLAMPFGLFASARHADAQATTAEANGVGGGVNRSATYSDVKLTVNYYRTAGDYNGWAWWTL